MKRLAATHKFESQSHIDWSDRRALFCLRMALGWKYNKLARAIGASEQQLGPWERAGVPQRSVRTWGRLAKLAVANDFDQSSILDDRLWTRERLQAAMKRSRQEQARVGRCCRLLDPGDPAMGSRDATDPRRSRLEAYPSRLAIWRRAAARRDGRLSKRRLVQGAPAPRSRR